MIVVPSTDLPPIEPSLDDAAVAFMGDLEGLEHDYWDEARGFSGELDAARRAAKQMVDEAERAHAAKAVELNSKYRRLVADAARAHARKSEHPEDLEGFADSRSSSVVGLYAMPGELFFNADIARSNLLSCDRKRREQKMLDEHVYAPKMRPGRVF